MTVTRIDRLARSTFDLFAIVKQIVDAGASSGHWPSRGPIPPPAPGRLMLAVLGGLADVERDLIKTRTAEGREPGEGPRAAYGPTVRIDRRNRPLRRGSGEQDGAMLQRTGPTATPSARATISRL